MPQNPSKMMKAPIVPCLVDFGFWNSLPNASFSFQGV